MKNILLGLFFLLSAGSVFAGGTSVTGGGKGCRAEILHVTNEVADWIAVYGNLLSPRLSKYEFLEAAASGGIVDTDEDLRFNGEKVDALFDGKKIVVQCNRFLGNTYDVRKRVMAHEVFRKMGLEGDDYEVSRQMDFIHDIRNVVEFKLGPSLEVVPDGVLRITCSDTKAGAARFLLDGHVTIMEERFHGKLQVSMTQGFEGPHMIQTDFPNLLVRGEVKKLASPLYLSPTFGHVIRFHFRIEPSGFEQRFQNIFQGVSIIDTSGHSSEVALEFSQFVFKGMTYSAQCTVSGFRP